MYPPKRPNRRSRNSVVNRLKGLASKPKTRQPSSNQTNVPRRRAFSNDPARTIEFRRAREARPPPGSHRFHRQNARRWRCAVAEAMGVGRHAVQPDHRQGVPGRQCCSSYGHRACRKATKIHDG